jgi:serine protease AprX
MVANLTPISAKLLVTLKAPEEAARVRATGVEVLAEYPDTLLVRATAAQKQQLESDKIEAVDLEQPPVQLAGLSFAFPQALEAERLAPEPPPPPHRTAYYIVKMVGPAKDEWLTQLRALGGTVQGDLPGFSLLVGLLPSQMETLRNEKWVEAITPYRPTMKVSAKLRPGVPRELNAAHLTALDATPLPSGGQQVEISVFRGESTADIAAAVRSNGGTVLKETAATVTALVSPQALLQLAAKPGVQAIVPHAFPKFHNNQAAQVMGIPANFMFGTTALRGGGQIVGVADSGLDSGNLATLHLDLQGRVMQLVSFPTSVALASLLKDPPGHDDGVADVHSAHGTHVAGSVLGNGAVARSVGAATVPSGVAPEASLYFQAVEQQVRWKTRAELIAEGIDPTSIPLDWPPEAVGLYGLPDNLNDLFRPAYLAGTRIHTNSWGSSDPRQFGLYTDNARQIDEFLWTHRDMLILVAAGNDGVDADEDGQIDPDSIGPPATAKNCLTVGACENNRPHASTPPPGIDANWNQLGQIAPLWPKLGPAGHVSDDPDGMAAFSSRGPTEEDRIKPDVVAPGTNILSVRSSAYAGAAPPLWGELPATDPLFKRYCWSGGTSMSTPLVAGAVALIRQHLVQNQGHVRDGVKPSGALLKALVINGAVAMAGHFPGEIPLGANTVNGFGRVHLAEALGPILQQTLFDDDPTHALTTGQMRTFTLTGVDTTQPLKVTLVWTDAPGLVGAGSVVNRLYLQIVQPDGTVLDGDVTPFPTVTNNVQQITIPRPAVGTYMIRVRGVSVTQHAPVVPGTVASPRQDFALVASNGTRLSL